MQNEQYGGAQSSEGRENQPFSGTVVHAINMGLYGGNGTLGSISISIRRDRYTQVGLSHTYPLAEID